MQKRLVQTATTALLFVTLAVPAYAHGNGDGEGGRGFALGLRGGFHGLGLSIAAHAKEKHDGDKEERKEERDERKDERKDERDEKHERRRAVATVMSACLTTARDAYNAALKTTHDAGKDALNAALSVYHQALVTARATRTNVRTAAKATFEASDKGEAARIIYATAKVKANVDMQAAYNAANSALFTARTAVQTTALAAKIKADADFGVAKIACASTVPPTDSIAPNAITNLTLSGATSSSAFLTWTAPGDDSATGTATSYDIRYSTAPIVTAADFTAATKVAGEPSPAVAGTTQSMTVSGLTANTTYYFAMQTRDEAANVSATGNVATTSTLIAADVTTPNAITNLAVSGTTSSSALLTWTAPGDDAMIGTATTYDIRYATSAITTVAEWNAATPVVSEPTPTIAGSTQSMTVTGLTTNTTYFFAMKSQDEVPNVSALSNNTSAHTL